MCFLQQVQTLPLTRYLAISTGRLDHPFVILTTIYTLENAALLPSEYPFRPIRFSTFDGDECIVQ